MVVFLSEYIHPKARKFLEDECTVVDNFDNPDVIDAIILRNFEVNASIIDRCKNLKVIGKHGVGCNTIDLNKAQKKGITVLNTPSANTNSVAEHIVGLILDIMRNITLAHEKTREGAFVKPAPQEMTGIEINGKILGLIGTGNIARRVATILQNGFDVKVIGYDPYVDRQSMMEMGYEKYQSLPELVAASDIINVSVPLTDTTKDLIAGNIFDRFKKKCCPCQCSTRWHRERTGPLQGPQNR